MKLKRIISAALLAAIAMSTLTISASAEEKDSEVNIYIAGDSTACEYGEDENYALPRGGWGMYLEEFVKAAQVTDLAKSGRSSKSLTTEEEYKELFDNIKEGDYLLIQFGHNDAKNTKPEDIELRYTEPTGDKDTEGSFKNSLYTNYIKPAQEKGAKPILITPISRRKFDDNGKVTDSHGLYDDAVRQLAAELEIPCADMTAATEELYNKLGVEKTKTFHAIFKDGEKGENGFDNTHLNRFGAERIAAMTALKLKTADKEGIGSHVDSESINKLTEQTVTRGSFTENTVRLLALANESEEPVAAAERLGILKGNEKGELMLDDAITIQDMAVIFYRVMESVGIDTAVNESLLDKYTDADQVSGYAKAALASLVNDGIISAEADKLMPKAAASADVQAQILATAYEKKTKADEVSSKGEMSLDELEKVE